MALKDLALLKLVGSALKKGKDKITGAAVESKQENELNKTDESVKDTFKSVLGKTNKDQLHESDVSKELPVKTEEKEQLQSAKIDVEAKTEVKAQKQETSKTAAVKSKEPSEKKSVKEKPVKKEKIEKETKKKSSTEKSKKPAKETTVEKSTSVKTKSAPKAKEPKKKETTGTKREEKIKLYAKDIQKHYGSVDDSFLAIVVKNLGPSIYRKDAELVSCSDPKELETVRRNFLIKKLGFDKNENEMLDGEIKKVCETLKGVRSKYRATFYYILAKNLKKESALS